SLVAISTHLALILSSLLNERLHPVGRVGTPPHCPLCAARGRRGGEFPPVGGVDPPRRLPQRSDANGDRCPRLLLSPAAQDRRDGPCNARPRGEGPGKPTPEAVPGGPCPARDGAEP